MFSAETTALILIDVQGNLAHSVVEKESLFENVATLIHGMKLLGVPIVVTEQYPKGLGTTIPQLADILPSDNAPISKTHFNSCEEALFMNEVSLFNRNNLLICGIETHICVYQTAVGLVERGYTVDVVADAVSSRTRRNYEIGLAKMQAKGVGVSSVEMALYELIGKAEGDAFKGILKLVK